MTIDYDTMHTMIENAFNILVIVLSLTLFIFLIIAIVVAIAIAKLVKSLSHITEKGVLLADKAEATINAMQERASLAGLAKMINGVVGVFTKSKKEE